MNISKERKNQILIKNENLIQLKQLLKQQYIGIDGIIDNVINSLKPFYLFPESLTKPIVINLWGMTGTGKTTMVEKIVKFLGYEKSYIKYDMGNTSNMDFIASFEKGLNDTLPNNNFIIALDEFQLGRTINEDHREKDAMCRLIWDLIDSGKMNHGRNKHIKRFEVFFNKLVKYKFEDSDIDENGYTANVNLFNEIINRTVSISDFENKNDSLIFGEFQLSKKLIKEHGKIKFIALRIFELMVSTNPNYFNYDNSPENRDYFFNKPIKQIIETIEEAYKTTKQINSSDYSKSLIFCMGNLDEIYYMSENLNPDMDADMFHKDSLKINITDVKRALAKKFRPEQISRLGNVHFIYPAFSRANYEEYISVYLKNIQEKVLIEYGLTINFSDTVNDIIYKEGIFPSQGIRPLQSTLTNFIDKILSMLITDIVLKSKKITEVTWSYLPEEKSFKVKNKKDVFKYKIETCLEDLRLINNNQVQALVAVHEAGHALVSSLVLSLAPEEILSKTASEAQGYCLFRYGHNPKTKAYLLNQIKVLLAGSEAEKLIFGKDNITVGSTSDIMKATDIAFNIVKRYGMNNISVNISANLDENITGKFVKDESQEETIKNIILKLQKETRKLLKENKKYLLLLSDTLSKKPKIYKDEVKEILKDLNITWNDEGVYYDFEKELKRQLEETI
jgi:hypothetical protein